jgi:hypothetical protein
VLANGINDVTRSINLGNSSVAKRNCKLFIGTNKALHINIRCPQKPMLLVKHSRHSQEVVMRKKLLSILALTILVASSLVGCGQGSPSTLTIISITDGDVFVMKAGTDDWIKGEVGMSLEVGDSIKTGDDSGAEITFFDGSTIELKPGTEIEIASLDISTDTGSTTISLKQTIGSTVSRVTKILDPASSYEVETPSGVAAVRGSWLRVDVAFDDVNYEDSTTWITNLEGNIYAIGQGVELQVPEGQTCIIIFGEPPELISLEDVWVNILVCGGPPAWIYIVNNITGEWAIEEGTGKLVDGTNHLTPDTIRVTGGSYYCVWVEAPNITYNVKNCPPDWSITSAPNGGEAACGILGPDPLNAFTFTERVG